MGGDTLTCGHCRQEFPLQEIARFIQHKVLNKCTKEGYERPKSSTDSDGETKESSSPDKGDSSQSLGSPSVSGSGQNEDGAEAKKTKTDCVDAEANTTVTGRGKFFCCFFLEILVT